MQAEKLVNMDHVDSNSLPLWMKEAAESELSSQDSDASCGYQSLLSMEEEENNETTVKTLDIPTIDWDKLNEEKNRNNNKLLSSTQRKQVNKEKQNAKGRTRKITPSQAPSLPPLKQLASLKKTAAEFEITEEDEEIEE